MNADLRKLIQRSFDEPLDEAEVAQLNQALIADEEARRLYEELAHLHAGLVTLEQTSDFCGKVVRHELQLTPEVPQDHQQQPPEIIGLWQSVTNSARRLPLRSAAALLALGVGLGCGVGLLAAVIVHSSPQFLTKPWVWSVPADVVARIESTKDVVWQMGESPETPPTRGLRVGQEIRIEEGLLQVTHRSGANVILRGPAVYLIRSAEGGKLFSGQLSAVVPPASSVFSVETPVGVFQTGAGHFGVDVENTASSRKVIAYAFEGQPMGTPSALFVRASGKPISFEAGHSLEIDSSSMATVVPVTDASQYPVAMPAPRRQPFEGDSIYLGNLFDDCKMHSLSEAMASDTYQAAAETIDLGVAAVHDGGLDLDVCLAEDGVLFNFSNVGGGGSAVLGLPSNDTYRSVLSIPIRTTGDNLPFTTDELHAVVTGEQPTKMEEGVGISSNELLTFDLDEIRQAGLLEGRHLRFVSDRAGINDREFPLETSRTTALVNLIVVVSNREGVLSAYLNGEPVDVVKQANVYAVQVDEQQASEGLRYDGRFVRFDVPITPDAKFLTLVSASLGVDFHDHAVFSGARLEVEAEEDEVVPQAN